MNKLLNESFTTKSSFRTSRLVWYIFATIETLLFVRFFLKLFGANPVSGFTDFIYNYSSYIVSPFTSVFGLGADGRNVFDWATILAIITYWVLAFGFIRLIEIGRQPLSRIEQARALSKKKYSH